MKEHKKLYSFSEAAIFAGKITVLTGFASLLVGCCGFAAIDKIDKKNTSEHGK